jgi:hypothetical protein
MIEFYVDKQIWTDSISLYARKQSRGQMEYLIADGLKAIPAEKGLLAPKFLDFPMLEGAAQSLFDALWKAGFRPNGGEASAAHVEAMKYHLEDMRKLVFVQKRNGR